MELSVLQYTEVLIGKVERLVDRIAVKLDNEPTEITEEGITKLFYTRGRFTKEVTPAGRRAKWFRDSLGQMWCKFDIAPLHARQYVCNIVIPASSVVEVQYEKSGG